MTYLFLILALAAEPNAVDAAYAAVTSDLSVLSKATSDVAALATATARQQAAKDALAKSRLALTSALDAAASDIPLPPVIPPVNHVVEILCLSSDSCLPCKKFEPTILAMQADGIPITISKDVADAARYAIKSTPTYVMLVDKTEVSRAEVLQEQQIRTWLADTVVWSKKK